MKTRLITALVMILVLVPPIFIQNSIPMIVLGTIVALIGFWEYRNLSKNPILYLILGLAWYFAFALGYDQMINMWLFKIFGAILILYAIILVVTDAKKQPLIHGVFNILYIGMGAGVLIAMKQINYNLLIYSVVVISMTDVFAYLFGVRYGKHKLAPTISPKKSIEGSVAGTVFGTGLGTLFLLFSNVSETLVPGIGFMILLSISLSIVGQFGDLFASKIKRGYGVKDFGSIFPGHGGVLDRFDSLLLASMVVLLLLF